MLRSIQASAAAAVLLSMSLAAPAAALRAGSVQVETVRMRTDAVRNPAGDLPAGAMLHVVFALRVPNQAALDAFTASQQDPRSPNYHQWLTPAQFGARFGASDDAISQVTGFALANGLAVEHVWAGRLSVTLGGTVAQFENALQVRIVGWNRPDTTPDDPDPTCYAPDADPVVPSTVGAVLRGIYGLSNVARTTPADSGVAGSLPQSVRASGHARKSAGVVPNGTAWPGPVTPAQISHVYQNDLLQNTGLHGDTGPVAVVCPTTFTTADVTSFASTYSLTGYTIVQRAVDGGAANANGAQQAETIIETIIGQAPHATLVLYQSPDADNMVDIYNAIANDNFPVAISAWGRYEDAYHTLITGGDGFVATQNTALQQIAAEGISLFCSSGDGGAFDPATSALSVRYPASSQFATAIGGTGLPTQNGGFGWDSEVGWASSGGGNSIYFTLPPWQAGPNVSNGQSNGMRQVPDGAALADPTNPGYSIYYSGGLKTLGGTAAAAALWAANALLANQQLQSGGLARRIGQYAPELYHVGTALNSSTDRFVYHDIMSGGNATFTAQGFWDYVTGWGSANQYKLMADLCLAPDLVPYNPGSSGPGGTWNSPIAIHASFANSSEPQFFELNTTYEVGICALDNGPADAAFNTQALLQNGTLIASGTLGPFAAANGTFTSANVAFLGNLNFTTVNLTTPGAYDFGLRVNYYRNVTETNFNNNSFDRIIGVASANPAISAVAVSPGSIVGGNSVAGSVTLSSAAPAGGVTVALLSSSPAVASVPTVVTVAAGATTAPFTVTTGGVGATNVVTIYGHCGGVTVSTTLSVAKAIINNVTINPTPVAGGVSTTGTINLTGAAPAAGLLCTLSSTNTNAATVPPSVTVPAGANTVNFTITTLPQQTDTGLTINATAYGSTRTAGLTVQYPRILSWTFNPNPVPGGTTSLATITLTGPTPSNGLTFSIASSNFPVAQVPITFAVLPGNTTGGFLITTHDPAVNTTVTITLTTHGVNTTNTITVNH